MRVQALFSLRVLPEGNWLVSMTCQAQEDLYPQYIDEVCARLLPPCSSEWASQGSLAPQTSFHSRFWAPCCRVRLAVIVFACELLSRKASSW